MTKYIIGILSVALAASMLANFFAVNGYLSQRDRATKAVEITNKAVLDAKTCSQGVETLRETIKGQEEAQKAEIEAAKAEAFTRGKAAATERTRPQAVPGNVCESAKVETSDWLKRRQAVK